MGKIKRKEEIQGEERVEFGPRRDIRRQRLAKEKDNRRKAERGRVED
jgi:hypothetical protein